MALAIEASHRQSRHHSGKRPTMFLMLVCTCLFTFATRTSDAQYPVPTARPHRHSNRYRPDKPVLKDAFYEDNRAIVRIRTTYNATYSVSCNGVVMDTHNLVLSDISCIKYQGMANIDARFVQVIAGEPNQEELYEVEQIFINKANPNDPSTELALLKLKQPIPVSSGCVDLKPPDMNMSFVPDIAVRVIGYTNNFELKENRTKVSRRFPKESDKYVCTAPSDYNESPGSFLMKGAPLIRPVECNLRHMIGILTRVDTFFEGKQKSQDCFVMINSQLRWYNQVKMLALGTLAAKDDAGSAAGQPNVRVVTVDD